MNIKMAIAQVVKGVSLKEEEMVAVMTEVMTGKATPAQIGGFLVGLSMKGETVDELVGAVRVMRGLSKKVSISADNLIDTCGTGGDGANLFNVSTAAAFVVAASGGFVAKHGNRSVSSSTGSADLLEAAGVKLDVSPDVIARAVENVGVGFMFAPSHHGAMKHSSAPRKELGFRTMFNILGPLTNPADVKRQVVGVFSKELCRPIAEVLMRLGSEHVLVVHAEDGLDELSVASIAHVAELKNGVITEYYIDPKDFGFNYEDLEGLAVNDAKESLALISSAFKKREGNAQKAADIIALNAGAALYVGGIASSIKEGVEMAEDSIISGGAMEKLKELAEFTSV